MDERNIKKHKICYIATPITFGGVEKVNTNFLKNVDNRRFEMIIILFLRPWETKNDFVDELVASGLKFISIPVAKSNGDNILRIFRCFFQLLKIVKEQRCDLMHTHGYIADILGYFVSIICGIPIISTCHGYIYSDYKLSMYNKADCLVLKHFDRIVAVSDSIQQVLIENGVKKEKIKIIENAPLVKDYNCQISEDRDCLRKYYNLADDDILIGYVGRLSKEKGLNNLLKAFAMLASENHSIKLVLVGEGPEKGELANFVSSAQLEHRVFFAGFQERTDRWYRALDLFVLPSLTEGTPMVLLEAMSHGIPCIASKVGGVPQVIDSGVDGILVAPGNPDEILNAMQSILVDQEKRNMISLKAKQKILSKYDFNKWMKSYVHEYMELVTSGV